MLPDQEPEKGYYYRADHFEFAKAGVPAITYGSGYDYIGRPSGWGLQKHQDYTAHDYHKPSDEIKPDWDLSGTVEDLRLLMDLGYAGRAVAEYPAMEERLGIQGAARCDDGCEPVSRLRGARFGSRTAAGVASRASRAPSAPVPCTNSKGAPA